MECPICKLELSKIDSQHLRKHGLSKDEYFNTYGKDAPFGYSAELKAKKSGENHPGFGKSRSQETKDKVAKGVKKLWDDNLVTEKQKNGIGERSKLAAENGEHFNKGKTHERSDEYRNKLSSALNEYYRNNPKPSLSTERMQFQLPHLEKIARNKRAKASEKLHKDLELEWGTVDIDSEHFQTGNFRFAIKCNLCGTITNAALVTLKKHNFGNTLCHTCFPPLKGESKAEKELAEFVSQYVEIIRHCKNILDKNLELDILIPSKNIAIEYHGLYWHSSKMNYDKYKHRKKYDQCRTKGIRLIQIFEDEWLNKPELIKAKLLHILGIEPDKKVFARKTQIDTISSSEANKFLEQYHSQGSSQAVKNLGLYYQEELIAVMTFCKPRKILNQISEEGTWELLRYATQSGIHVIGGASKLLSHFVKNMNPNKIISWADLRWTDPDNNVYLALGFTLERESKVGVFFTNCAERKHRWGFRRPNGLNQSISTKDYWESKGWFTITDAGQLKYSLIVNR